MIEIRPLKEFEALSYLETLAEVLMDCVEGGASVGLMTPLTRATAESFFAKAIEGVRLGERILLAAFVDSQLVGTVQIVTGPTNRTGPMSPSYWF